MKSKVEYLRTIGKNARLKGRKLEDFIKFYKDRFPRGMTTRGRTRDIQYASKWASKFLNGTEWVSSDLASRRSLQRVNPKKYPKNINALLTGDDIDNMLRR